jgi:hypothetical protein
LGSTPNEIGKKKYNVKYKMNVVFGDDRKIKKRITKQLRENFAQDQGFSPALGATKPDAKAFDDLETALEKVETTAQLVANQLERDEVLRLQDPTQFQAPSAASAFYVATKAAIGALKKTDFTGLPRSDIAGLESYFDRLRDFDFDKKFADLLQNFDPAAIGVDFPEEQQLIDAREPIIQRLEQTVRDLDREHERFQRDPRAPARHMASMQQLTLNRAKLEDDLGRIDAALEKGRRVGTTKASRRGLVEKDLALVVPTFKVLLNSLENGLQTYKSGVSGKNVIVGGAYTCMMGGADYLPRRFM